MTRARDRDGCRAGARVDVTALRRTRGRARRASGPGPADRACASAAPTLWSPARPFLYDLRVRLRGAGDSVRELRRDAQDRRATRRRRRQPAVPEQPAALPVRSARPGLVAGRTVHGADRRGPALRHRDAPSALGFNLHPQAREGGAGALVLPAAIGWGSWSGRTCRAAAARTPGGEGHVRRGTGARG